MAMVEPEQQYVSPIPEMSDGEYTELIRRIAEGDAEAFATLLGTPA